MTKGRKNHKNAGRCAKNNKLHRAGAFGESVVDFAQEIRARAVERLRVFSDAVLNFCRRGRPATSISDVQEGVEVDGEVEVRQHQLSGGRRSVPVEDCGSSSSG